MVAPSIIYCLVSRGTVVFCEHTGDRGNFQQVTRTILEKIDATEDAKHSYSYDDCTFHMVVEHGIIYLAMSDKDFDRQVAAMLRCCNAGRVHACARGRALQYAMRCSAWLRPLTQSLPRAAFQHCDRRRFTFSTR
jgi:hypothetical protein